MKIGITFSAFDLLHAGHILMLKESKEMCDYLIVGLLVDPSLDRDNKNKPVESLFERYIKLKSIKYIDEIIVYETEKDLENILNSIRTDIRFIGEDYKDKDFTGKKICIKNNIDIVYNSRKHEYSSTKIRNDIIGNRNI
jgi:glycerol-3-phosphate cytidylyltransferase